MTGCEFDTWQCSWHSYESNCQNVLSYAHCAHMSGISCCCFHLLMQKFAQIYGTSGSTMTCIGPESIRKIKMTFCVSIVQFTLKLTRLKHKYARKWASCEDCLRPSHVTVDTAVFSLALWFNSMRWWCVCFVFIKYMPRTRNPYVYTYTVYTVHTTEQTQWAIYIRGASQRTK